MDEEQLQALARRRVAIKLGFGIHLLVFVLVNGGLSILSLSRGTNWHWGPLLGWGLGLAVHGVVTLANLRGQGIRQRLLDAEVQRLRARR